MRTEIKQKLAEVLFSKANDIIFVQAVTGLLMALGFAIGDSTNNNYQAINALAPLWAWSFVFLIYGSVKLVSLFRPVNFYLNACSSASGLWSWAYVVLSFTLFDSVPVTSTEVLLVVPLLAEIWALASIIYQKGTLWK